MNKSFKTPILLLVYNRPKTTELVFNEIRRIKPSKLFISSDGPKNDKDVINCNKVRDIIKQIDWDCDVKYLLRDENLGCGKAVSSSIDWFFNNVDEGIILEDDCLPSTSFFYFCQELLKEHRHDSRIMCISGDNSFKIKSEESYYYSNIPLIWGWATWKRAWNKYDFNMTHFPQFYEKHSHSFYSKDLLNSLLKTYDGKIDTWDYQWTFANIINNGLTCVSSKNLISNIGFNDSGTHTKKISSRANIPISEIKEITHPLLMLPEFLFQDTFLSNIKLHIKRMMRILLK